MDIISQKHISLNNLTHSKEQQKPRKVVEPPPNLTLPFPPHIIPEDVISSKTRKLPSKPPNAFFIYRKVYTKELIAQNLRFKMTDVSPWVSISWKLEPEVVKSKYKEIAEEVRKIYKQTKLDIADESETSSANTSPKPQPSTPLPTSPINEDNFNFEHSSNPEAVPELYYYGQSIDTESQNPIVDNDLNYYNNNTFSSLALQSTLWQNNPELYNLPQTFFENISTELAYSKYMTLPINSQVEPEPFVLDFHNDVTNSFEWNYGEEYNQQY